MPLKTPHFNHIYGSCYVKYIIAYYLKLDFRKGDLPELH
jgi:hypothetical protein